MQNEDWYTPRRKTRKPRISGVKRMAPPDPDLSRAAQRSKRDAEQVRLNLIIGEAQPPCTREIELFDQALISKRAALEATYVCDSCPVRKECGQLGALLRERNGVWGGKILTY
jgi:hypothetical protein